MSCLSNGLLKGVGKHLVSAGQKQGGVKSIASNIALWDLLSKKN